MDKKATRIILRGCNGRMGREVSAMAADKDGYEIVAGIDVAPNAQPTLFPTYTDLDSCPVTADVIIDFSRADTVPQLIKYASEKNIPVVVCTTGLSEETQELLMEASKTVGIFKSANMYLGINLLAELVSRAAKLLYDADYDIEIIEKHHSQKLDAPSGTALMLADAVNDSLNKCLEYTYDRSGKRAKRSKNELGIHSIRAGTIVGEHSVIFAGNDEVLEFSHSAMSRRGFALGALKAASFMKDKTYGYYTMKDIMKDL